MAKLNVIRTDGSVMEVLKEKEMIHLFLTELNNTTIVNSHEIGDVLTNSDSELRFAIIVKNYINEMINVPALRVGIINLFKHLVENELVEKGLIISSNYFSTNREESEFISTIKEFLMTYFGEVITEDVNLIIADCRK